MVTGVSLRGADAALVPLQQAGGVYVPIALAIKGNYNRLGSIDGIEEDANTRRVLRFFLEGLQTGDFVVDEEYMRGHRAYPIQTIEKLLHAFERNMNDHPRAAVLGGQPVVFALIARSVWDTIAGSSSAPGGSTGVVFGELFAESPVAGRIYSGASSEVSDHVRELAAMCAFLRDRGIAWKLADDLGQDYTDDMQRYLAEARRDFGDSTVILVALDDYEREVEDLLRDD